MRRESLRRLKLDRIDVYQLHRSDAKVPIEKPPGELKDMQNVDKDRRVGLQEVSPEQVEGPRKIVPM
jgi:aryl-alcohol dehydrogenase-like predicted oxidoreductase